ncbi:inverse autotransporter beta domain-containing protein, partial [Serratia bockelmannii]|uniref:inverse autotransporter beta domain-containing protein n=1 Tax=Serratia bockelmannii TaxID=2703793 RepID=UPI002362C59B
MNTHKNSHPPHRNKRFFNLTIWISISAQLFPIVSGVLLPVMRADADVQIKNPTHTFEPGQATTSHTLVNGETIASVARKYGLSISQLRQLNQFRVFSRGFDNVHVGDELDVPLSPGLLIQKKAEPGSELSNKAVSQEGSFASFASQAGNALSGNNASVAAQQLAVSKTNQEVQSWLQHFGTARVQLNTDKHFSVMNSQFDLLFPLWEDPDDVFFMQTGIHRNDDRSQSSLGIGWRYFTPEYMAGINSFIDHDLSQKHSRYGIGSEYRRDNFKVSANLYRRLSDWRNIQAMDEYVARPANGWDVRTEGYLPAYPQFGAKLTFEQYYGNDVALLNRDRRQQNPRSITWGMMYTPVPMVTFNVEQRQGNSERDIRFGIDTTFHLGESLSAQLDGDNVAALRSLAGGRYDLVDRNSEIVLEYRKKVLLHISLPGILTGHAGETLPINVSISARDGFDHISWSAPELEAHGGRIINQPGGSYSVLLPTWNSADSNKNSYTISATAYDKKGNASDPVSMIINVQPPSIDNHSSSIKTANSSIAPGEDNSITLKLVDTEGNPITGLTDIGFLVSGVTPGNYHIGSVVEGVPGTYTASLNLPVVGTVTIVPTVGGVAVNGLSSVVTVKANVATALIKDNSVVLSGNVTSQVADGTSQFVYTAQVTDTYGNPLSGITVNWSVSNAVDTHLSATNSVSDATGHAQITLTSTTKVAKNLIVSASIGQSPVRANKTVSFVAGQQSPSQSNMSVVSVSTSPSGETNYNLSFTAKDVNGNPVDGLVLSTVLGGSSGIRISGWTDNGDGTYSAIVTVPTGATGNITVMPTTVTGNTLTSAIILTTQTATVDTTLSTLTTSQDRLALGGKTVLTFTALDSHGNHIPGLTVNNNPLVGTASPGALLGPWNEQSPGTYTTTLTAGTTSGTIGIMPVVAGEQAVAQALFVSVIAGTVDATKSTLTTPSPASVPVNGTS